MKKNIILLDRDGKSLEFILKNRNDDIIVLVCEKKENIKSLIQEYSTRIHHIIDYEKLLDIQDVKNIDYKIIEKMKFAQIDIETMLHRIMLNNPLAKDIYHQHLSFFIGIFKKNRIDLIFCSEPNLASPNHLIPFALGKLFGIPVYSIDSYLYNIVSINNYNLNTNIKLSKIQKPSVDIGKIFFYKLRKNEKKIFSFKEKIKSIIFFIGGAMLYEFISCILKCSFKKERLGVPYSFLTKLKSFMIFKDFLNYYDKHAILPNLKEHYIYYSIHLEPEAAIIGRTILESQLTIIKMLANALPDGWKLYVKEHPHQLMLNNEENSYFINNIEFFKNKIFYEEILKLPNTFIVSLDMHPKDLIVNSRAVATMSGTVTLEAAKYNKFAILFSPESGLYGMLNNTLHIHRYSDLQTAIEKIYKEECNIELDKELELLQEFLTDIDNENFYYNLFLSIDEHSKSIKRIDNII